MSKTTAVTTKKVAWQNAEARKFLPASRRSKNVEDDRKKGWKAYAGYGIAEVKITGAKLAPCHHVTESGIFDHTAIV